MSQRIFHYFVTLLTVLILMLGIVPPASAQEPTADLALSKTADRKNVKIGENITFTITVTNLGTRCCHRHLLWRCHPRPSQLRLGFLRQRTHFRWSLRGGQPGCG